MAEVLNRNLRITSVALVQVCFRLDYKKNTVPSPMHNMNNFINKTTKASSRENDLHIFSSIGRMFLGWHVHMNGIFNKILELVKFPFNRYLLSRSFLTDIMLHSKIERCTRYIFFPRGDSQLHHKCTWYTCLVTLPLVEVPPPRMNICLCLFRTIPIYAYCLRQLLVTPPFTFQNACWVDVMVQYS